MSSKYSPIRKTEIDKLQIYDTLTAFIFIFQIEFTTDPKKGPKIMDYLTVGNLLGETTFLTKSSRKKTIRTETPAEVSIKSRLSVHRPR